MPKLKRDEVADLDVKVLDEQEYTEGDFDTYEGEIPPANTELTGYVSKLWWCRTAEKDDGSGLDPMIKVLWVAADNEGDLEDFNGLPIWENLVLVPSAKFRWAPFLDVHGITLKAIKTSTYVGEEDDERIGGAPIEKIGDFEPGEESDAAWSRLITKRRFWNDEWRAEAKSWMAWADGEGEAHPAAEAADDADGEDGTEEPDDTIYEDDEGYLVNADGDYVDEEGDLVDEPVAAAEEPEEPAEPEPPARTRGRGKPAAAKPAAAKPAARASKPAAAARPAGRAAAKPAAAKPAAAATSSRRGKPAAAKPAAATGRGRGKAAKDNEPPF
jgi:hypothetical protein